MIISHRHKFIFIKTVKTAGTSIEVFLSQHCGPGDVLTPVRPPVEGHKARNYQGFVYPIVDLFKKPFGPVSDLRHRFRKTGEILQSHAGLAYSKACRCRDLGQLLQILRRKKSLGQSAVALSHECLSRRRCLTLDEYLVKGKLPINYPRYTDLSGERIIVDRVVRYENLLSELAELFARVNVPFEGNLGVRAKSEYRTDRSPYQSVFNDKQRRIVEKAFAREIELHGYRF